MKDLFKMFNVKATNEKALREKVADLIIRQTLFKCACNDEFELISFYIIHNEEYYHVFAYLNKILEAKQDIEKIINLTTIQSVTPEVMKLQIEIAHGILLSTFELDKEIMEDQLKTANELCAKAKRISQELNTVIVV